MLEAALVCVWVFTASQGKLEKTRRLLCLPPSMLCHRGLWPVQWCAPWMKCPVSTSFTILPSIPPTSPSPLWPSPSDFFLSFFSLTHLWHWDDLLLLWIQSCWWPRRCSFRCPQLSGRRLWGRWYAASSGNPKATADRPSAIWWLGLGIRTQCRAARHCAPTVPRQTGNCPALMVWTP